METISVIKAIKPKYIKPLKKTRHTYPKYTLIRQTWAMGLIN